MKKQWKSVSIGNNLRPMYIKDNIIRGDKIEIRLYLLQEVKANYFLKLNVGKG